MCPFGAERFDDFRVHVARCHKNDPRFKMYCDIGNCAFSTKSYTSFKSHMSRNHKDIANAVHENEDFDHDEPNEMDIDKECDTYDTKQESDMLYAQYLLSLETMHRLTEKAVDVVHNNTEQLITHFLNKQKDAFKGLLTTQNVQVEGLDDISVDTGHAKFSSRYKRTKFLVNECNLIQPQEVLLGTRDREIRGVLKTVRDMGYIIPLKGLLQSLVNMPEVLNCIDNPHNSTDEYLWDICDGEYVRTHPLFSTNRNALQIMLYMDDLEIVNPLGAHTRKHKMSMFYVTLLNIPPEYRSRLSSIYLLAIAKTQQLKRHGLNKILRDFIETINLMSSTGIELIINSETRRTFKGGLVCLTADTPAANLLCGFKEGVGFAKKPCRACHVSAMEMSQKLLPSQLQLRTYEDHLEKCSLLFDQHLTKGTRTLWSMRWGINSKSVLLQIAGFDVCKHVLFDPMHVLLEGLLPNELALLLYFCIEVKHFFTLKWLNAELGSFPYTYLQMRDKPEPIQKTHYFNELKVKQTSGCMLVLCDVLPFILAKKVPHDDPKFANFICLIQITYLFISPCNSATTADDLQQLVWKHHTAFKKQYPKTSFTPKMHFLIHASRQLALFGPGRPHWCMRYEAKNSYFSSIKWKNFKNLPKSMAMKHQKWLCCQMLSPMGVSAENYLYEGDSVQKGEELQIDHLYPQRRDIILHTLPGVYTIYQAEEACIHGNMYKSGCILTLGYEEDLFPLFGWLEAIYVNEHRKHFLVKKVTIVNYMEVVNAYEINITNELHLVNYNDLFLKMPLSVHFFEGSPYICNKYGFMSSIPY
jgi:hypothetical protein